MRREAGTAAAEAAEGVRIHRKLNAEADRAAAAMSGAEATKRRALAEGDTRAAERAEQDLRRARQDYARVPRARGASKLAQGVPLDALAPGEKRALGLGPEGFPLDGPGLTDVGLDKPLVSLGPDGSPVLSPAAAGEVARVSPELARRMEATERDISEQPVANVPGSQGQTRAGGISGDAAGGGGASPSPDLARGREVLFRQDGQDTTGHVISPIAGGGVLVQTGDGPVVISTADITGTGSGTKAGPASPTRGSGTRQGPPLSPPRANQGGAGARSPRKGDKVAFRIHGREMSGTVIQAAKNGTLRVRAGDKTLIVKKRDVVPSQQHSRGGKRSTASSLKAADIPGNDPKPLSDWLADQPELLDEARRLFKAEPQWQGIDPDSALVFYRPEGEANRIRWKKGEGPGHHPHGLALGGPSGQKLTHTGEKGRNKTPRHTEATNFQNKLIKAIKTKLGL